MGDEGSEERGFTVIDKRGQSDEAPAEETAGQPGAGAAGDAGEAPRAEPPKIDFSTFVLSLGTSALFHMGLIEDPETGKPVEPNLPLARQTIDTIEMLQEKTVGNLQPEEAHLIESLLYELRMRFVEAGR